MNKNSSRFCHGRKISRHCRHWTDLKATGSYWSSNRRCFNMKPTPSIWCSTVHSLFLTHREKTVQGARLGGEAISVPEFQMEFLPVNLFLFTEGWWEEEGEEELWENVGEWVSRRGRGKGDLLTATTTHSKRSSKRTDGMREGWEKEHDREGRRERERNERKRRWKRRRRRGKRNTCDVLSLTHESSQPPHCHELMLLLTKSTDKELERGQVLLSQDN